MLVHNKKEASLDLNIFSLVCQNLPRLNAQFHDKNRKCYEKECTCPDQNDEYDRQTQQHYHILPPFEW